MQFSFKRPSTSKSVSAFYRDRQKIGSLPKTVEPVYSSQFEDQNDQNNKWRKAAQKINKDMVLHKALHNNAEPFRLLSKIGGQVYKSQPKLTRTQTPPNKTRIRVTSKQKKSHENIKQTIPARDPGQQPVKILQGGIGESKLKRRRRGDNFRMGLQQQLKTTNIFYESPVVKIGYNMQFEAYLRFEHINQIRPDHGGSICRNSIIFFLKDAPFSPNIISEKNTEIPIALSLFPQFFDSKLSISNIKRQKYFQRMLDAMNSTYDPQRMASLPRFSEYPSFDHAKYNEIMESLITNNQQNYKAEWTQNIVKKLRIKLSQRQMKEAIAQQWQFFNRANAMIILDYVLKNVQMANKLQVAPYLPTRIITARKILYHGGYCKSLYTSWSSYVQNSRKRLGGRLKNYTNITQAIYGWYCNFQDLQLFQAEFCNLLQESVSVDLFYKIQQAKIEFGSNVLQQIWFRGIMCLFHYGKYLMKKEGEYDHLGNYRNLLAKYIREARSRSHQMKSGEEIQVFYLNFYQNFLTSLRKERKVRDLQQLIAAIKGDAPQLNNLKVLLQIQFGKTIQRSFYSLRKLIVEYKKPLLRLHLIIDRQSFKFLQQQQDILSSFAELIKKIFGVKISGYALACKFQTSQEQQLLQKANSKDFNHQLRQKSETIRQYPEIYETGQRNSLQQDHELNLAYRTQFIFDEQVREIINCIRSYYKECFSVLGQYEMYLPFIKLTTGQMIFSEEEGPIEQSFLKNLRVISRYKESIRQLQKLVKINIFEVDCAGPIRALEQRVREIEYMMEQNYINIIHEKIEAVDSELNSLKTSAHNVGLTAIDIEQTQEKLLGIKQTLKQLQGKMKKIAEMVLFCLDNRRKAETVVTCYCQLVTKKQDLHRDVESLLILLQSKRPEVEAQSEQQVQSLLKSIDRCLQNASQVQTTCFEFVDISEYIATLATLLSSFSELNADIQKHLDHCKLRSHLPVYQKIQLFRREQQRFELMIQYWRQFYSFQTYFKDISKVQARTIDFDQFNTQSTSSEEIIARMHRTEREWWQRDKIGWKPIIHRMHEYYSKKFKNDVDICMQLKPIMQILTNRKVRERHWQQYGLQNYRNITFRELIKLDAKQQQTKLQKMDEEVNFQYEIFLAYQEIQKKIKGHRLLIVDLNDSDVLDLPNLNSCVQFLRNVEIDIKQLMQRDVGDYYQGELQQLLILSQGTVGKLQEWRNVQQKYIKFMRFHMINDEYEHSLFAALIQLHRKLIKSYDIDNSVAFISKNIVMDSYLAQIAEELKQLEIRLTRFLATLRAQYPRLFLLSDEELFDFMSSGADLQKYLRKCFPQILNFSIREGSIERVGQRKQLIFAQPFYIQEMVGRVNSWVSTLEDQIRCRMKQFFKTNQVITEGKSTVDLQLNFYEKYPHQLSILDEQITFTEQLGQAVATEALRPLLQQIQTKIQFLIKQKRESFKLLLFILFREQINALLRVEQLHSQSFQWLKYPRFYKKGQLDVRVSFIHQENIYGFNYLQKSQLIHTDSVFMGNCLVGPSGCGKTAFAKYLAYLCGQQLLIFDPRCINHSQQSISSLLNYFRVNAFAGNWLLLQRVDLLGQSQLRLIAECLFALQQTLRQQSNKFILSGIATPLNRNCRVLLSVSTLSGTELPGRLCAIVRPVWMSTPNRRFLLELYLQSKRVNNIEVGKILKFCSWLQNHREISLQVLNWIRDQQDPELFSSSIFFQKAAHFGIFQGEGQALLQTLRSEQMKMNDQSDRSKFISLHEELLKNSQIVLFGQKSCGKTTQALNKLPQGKFILINAHHYTTNEELFEVVRAIRNLQHYSHVVFKHGLQFYPLMRDNLTHFRLLFLEDSLAQLQLGVVFDLRMINYAHLTENHTLDGTVQQMMSKVLRGEMSEHLKMMAKSSLFSKCLEKAGDAASERATPNQLYINFAKIMHIMLSQQYEFNVSFLFSLIWAFSFTIQEKRLQQIIRQVFNGEQTAQKNKFQKINPSDSNALLSKSHNIKVRNLQQNMVVLVRQTFSNRLIALTELVPLKKGRFVSSLQIGGVVSCFQDIKLVADQVVSMRSNFIANLSLIRQHLKSPMAIEGKDWLTTILSVSSPQNTKHYNFCSRSPNEVFMELFRGSKRSNNFYTFGHNLHVTFDDVHLANLNTLNSLTDLSEHGFALFLEGDTVHIYQTNKCQFTFAGKSSYPRFSKALRIVIKESTIATIFGQYVQCYCEKYLQVDRSIFSLLNLSNNLNRIYLQDTRYFWYKNPLLLVQTSGATTLTEFMSLYLDYFTEMLPQEKTELNGQRALLQLPRNSAEDDDGVINTTRKFIKFCNRTQLIQKLVADNEVLEQIQASQVQSIFYDKFIKNYFTKDILDYVVKVGKHIQSDHLLLLADNYPHSEKILRYACKISGRSLLSLRTKSIPAVKSVLSIDLQHCKEKELQELQAIVKLKSNNRFQGSDMRFVLTGNIHSSKAKSYIQRFPFLKSHFLTLVMQQHPNQTDFAKELEEDNSNTFVPQGTSNDYLQKLEQIANANKFSDELKEQFARVLQRYSKEERLNLNFYRKISSEMMINVDTINGALEEIPTLLAKIAQRQTQLVTTRNAHSTASVELQQKWQRWQQKRSTFSDLFHFKHEKQVQNLTKLNQNCSPIFVKMDKIERKMESIETLEFTRLKNNLKNNENSALALPLHTLLAFLHEKVEILPKDKLHQFVPSAFSSPATLSAVLRTIRQREMYDKQATEQETHMNKPIVTGLTGNRLKLFLSRAQQVGQSWKKLQKVSVIYKPLATWLSHFHTVAAHLKDYLQQQEQIDAHLASNLNKLNNKHGEIADVNYQKLNLPVFITQSQNRIQQINDTLSAFGLFAKNSEIQQRKLSRLKRFYNERTERLQKIGRLMMESEYMKKVSAGVSLYFKNIDQLSFHRALIRTTLNSCIAQRTIDPEVLFGVFTARADLFNFREKMEAQSMGFEELEIVLNLVQKHDKCLRLVQDRDSLIKGKLLEAAENRGFSVQVFQQASYPAILKFLQTKLSPSSRLLVLHQNIHYLEVCRNHNMPLFQQFIEESYAMAQQHKAELIYVTNYLPQISPQMHKQLDLGKVIVTPQRFMTDLSDIFNVALQKDTPKLQQKKRRGDLQTVVRQRNSLTKEIMSSIESLARVLQSQSDFFCQRSHEEAEAQQVFSQTLENQLSNLMGLQYEADSLQRQTTNYGYLPSSIRNLIQEQLHRYLSLYSLTDCTDTSTNNQFFPGREFYREWMALLKDLREQRISWFTRPEYRTVISEIVVKQDCEERPRQQLKKNEQDQTVLATQLNQAINPVFHRNNQQIFLALVQRLLRCTTWIQKSSLYQYALGAAVIQVFEIYNHPQNISNLLQLNVNSKDQINEQCLKVLKVFDQHEFFRGFEIPFDKLTVQFFDSLNDKTDQLSRGSEAAVITYYYLLSKLNPSDNKVEDFLLRFGELTDGKRVGLAHRYQFLKVLRSLRQNNEAVLRLTPPLNLSINLGDREKVVTIIQEEKYFVRDLVQVLRVRSLSKKRELQSVFVDMRRKGELVEILKQHYRASKQWLLLANFSVKQKAEVRQLLEELLSQLARLPPNPFFRIFIVLNREQQSPDSLYYNKFQVSRIKGCHSLSDSDYCLAVNTLVLQQLFQGGKSRELIQQLIVSTIRDQDDYTIAEARLQDLKAIFGKVARRNRLLKEEDLKLFYRNLVQQVARLGYLKNQHNETNFYQYLASYFSWARYTASVIRKTIEDQRQLAKMGLEETQLFQNTILEMATEQSLSIERINTAKIEEYFKNINSEFAETLRKQISINNQIESDKQFLQSLKQGKGISKAALQQAQRVCEVKYGLTANEGDSWVAAAAKRRLPLLRLLTNLKLRQICLSKKVDIQTPAQFWIFLTAFQQRQIKKFTRQLTLDRSELESRYSNGIGLFGNFMNTRDYTTRMKMVLVDEQTYNQMAISEQEVINALHNSGRVEGKFILAIRKTGPQKIAELNIQQVQVEKILGRFNVVLQIGGQLTLEISFK